MPTFDMIVIGSGPAGQRAAIQGAKLGKRVALIEKVATLGGCCINTGTIPSKTMREAVLHLSGYYYQNIYGINYRVKEKITMADLLFRVQHVIKTEVDVTQAQLSRNGIELISGVAQFIDPFHLRVASAIGQADYEAKSIVIATGTKPAESAKVPLNGRSIVNSDQILQMANLPRTLIVVGGGVVGVEYACMFAILGVRVILVEKQPRLLEFADTEMVEALSYHLRDNRVTMRMNEAVVSVEETALVATGWRASKLMHAAVYNEKDQKIGKIDDFIVSPDGTLSVAVIDVGGFLGLGTHRVAIPVQQFDQVAPKIVLKGASKEELKKMPEFKYEA